MLLLRRLILLGVLVILSIGASVTQAQGLYDSVPVSELPPDVAIEWVQLTYDRVMAERVNAPAAARIYGYVGVTLYEALIPGIYENNSLIGQFEHLEDLPWPAEDALYDWPAAAAAATSTVLTGLFAQYSADSAQAFADLRETQIAARTEATNAEIVARSVTFGDEIGAALLEWIAGDDYANRITEYTPPADDPSTWVPTQEGQRAVEPGWGYIRPLVLENADVCAIMPDVPFNTDPNSTFYAQAVEVMETGDELTQEQMDIAEYWVDTPGESGTPAGHWVLITTTLIQQNGFMLNRAAELYAMTGMTVMDAFIATWSLKYQVPLLRPETYINEYINPRWRPYIASPGFPEYPSGHSVVSGAVAQVLTLYFDGPLAFTMENITPGGDYLTRSFTSFLGAANDAAISRMFGGIHYRSAIENGVDMGRCIGNYIIDHIRLNPIRQGE